MYFVKLQCRTIDQCIQEQTGQTLDVYGRIKVGMGKMRTCELAEMKMKIKHTIGYKVRIIRSAFYPYIFDSLYFRSWAKRGPSGPSPHFLVRIYPLTVRRSASPQSAFYQCPINVSAIQLIIDKYKCKLKCDWPWTFRDMTLTFRRPVCSGGSMLGTGGHRPPKILPRPPKFSG